MHFPTVDLDSIPITFDHLFEIDAAPEREVEGPPNNEGGKRGNEVDLLTARPIQLASWARLDILLWIMILVILFLLFVLIYLLCMLCKDRR